MFSQTYSYRYNVVIAVTIVFFSCTFNAVNDEPLTITCINLESDTVSLWPRLIFAFSAKLKDSVVLLKISPDPGPQYSSFLNELKDTLYFNVTGVLSGNTVYTITLNDRITGENGYMLYPEDVSFTIVTKRNEHEPNNYPIIADTLFDMCYGTISPVNDTDYYFIASQSNFPLHLCLKSYERLTGFIITDLSGIIIDEQTGAHRIKQYTIDHAAITPFYVGIFSLSDNNARYELGLTNSLGNTNTRSYGKNISR